MCDCPSLSTIIVEEGNRYYDSRNNCNAIIETSTNTLIEGSQNTIIPNTVARIGNGAFSGHTHLTAIHIPNSVTQIMGNAFGNCTGLTCITVPSSVTSLSGGWEQTICDVSGTGTVVARLVERGKCQIVKLSDGRGGVLFLDDLLQFLHLVGILGCHIVVFMQVVGKVVELAVAALHD